MVRYWWELSQTRVHNGCLTLRLCTVCVQCVLQVSVGITGVGCASVSFRFCPIMSLIQTCRFSLLTSRCDTWQAFAVSTSPSFMWCLSLVETSPLELYYVVARQQSDLKCQLFQTGSEASSDFSCAFGGCRLQMLLKKTNYIRVVTKDVLFSSL